MKTNYPTREGWLEAAAKIVTPSFEAKGYKVPAIRVSVGWPSRKALAKKKALGECWSETCAKDGKSQIFLSPINEKDTDILAILLHEMIHAVVGNKCGHKGEFKKCAVKIGLEGKMTATFAGQELLKQLEKWAEKLGPFPHSALVPEAVLKETKKQGTRMIKCECGDCGYIARTTKSWLDEIGAPLCPCNKKAMNFELPESTDEEDTDESE